MKIEEVVSKETAYLITNMMEDVVQKGTGQAAKVAWPSDRGEDRYHERIHQCLVHRWHTEFGDGDLCGI